MKNIPRKIINEKGAKFKKLSKIIYLNMKVVIPRFWAKFYLSNDQSNSKIAYLFNLYPNTDVLTYLLVNLPEVNPFK